MNYKWFNHVRKNETSGKSAAVIRYDDGKDDVPKVIAHGRGALASRIIALAEENGVPLQEDASLVGNLIDMDLGDSIPPQLYAVIAEILLMLEEMEREA